MSVSIRKSHTGFRLVPTSVTSNDLEQPLFCVISPNLGWLITSQWLKIDL